MEASNLYESTPTGLPMSTAYHLVNQDCASGTLLTLLTWPHIEPMVVDGNLERPPELYIYMCFGNLLLDGRDGCIIVKYFLCNGCLRVLTGVIVCLRNMDAASSWLSVAVSFTSPYRRYDVQSGPPPLCIYTT